MKRPGSKRHGTKKFLGVIMAVGIIAAGTYAFTATNTVEATQAGDGVGTISGFDVSNVTYTQDALDPTLLSGYSFTLDGDATSVDARTVTGQLTWDLCVEGLLNEWSCTPPPGTTVESLNELRVIAVQ